jgi:hypothetical protein
MMKSAAKIAIIDGKIDVRCTPLEPDPQSGFGTGSEEVVSLNTGDKIPTQKVV